MSAETSAAAEGVTNPASVPVSGERPAGAPAPPGEGPLARFKRQSEAGGAAEAPAEAKPDNEVAGTTSAPPAPTAAPTATSAAPTGAPPAGYRPRGRGDRPKSRREKE